MNGTVIELPGVTINQQAFELEYSSDKAYVVTFKDSQDKEVKITVCFGRITDVNVKPI